MELLQNAEDSTYQNDVEPTISFSLLRKDGTSTVGAEGSLVVQCNEVGFTPDDVEAICAVGGSTKKRSQRQIGEKGIGFKSVFVVSKRPHISSRGYSFRFDEDPHPECGLGYIVPTWVEHFPTETAHGCTSFLLPLKQGKMELVQKQLELVEPELLLFLRKVRRLRCLLPGQPRMLEKATDGQVVMLSVESGQEPERSRTVMYWQSHKTVEVPKELEEETRAGVTETSLSLAFPLDGHSLRGRPNMYAFLPLELTMPFSFVINADFIVSASRERLQENKSWNRWLLGICLPQAFLESFLQLLAEKPEKADQFVAFKYIPAAKCEDKWMRVRKRILTKLKDNDVIPTWRPEFKGKTLPAPDLVSPAEAVYFPESFSAVFRVLQSADRLPQRFNQKPWVVHPDVSSQYADSLAALEVREFSKEDLARLLTDVPWVQSLKDELLVDLFLQICVHLPKTELLMNKELVPLEGGGWGKCTGEGGILYVADPKAVPVLQGTMGDIPGNPTDTVRSLRGTVYQGLVNSDVAQRQVRHFWQCPRCSQQFFQWEEDTGLLLHLVKTKHALTYGGKMKYQRTSSIVPVWLDGLGLKPLSAVRYCLAITRVLRDHMTKGVFKSTTAIITWVQTLWRLPQQGIEMSREDYAALSKQLIWATADGGSAARATDVLLPPELARWPRLFAAERSGAQVLSPRYLRGLPEDEDTATAFCNFLLSLGVQDVPHWRPPMTKDGDCDLPPLVELTEEVVPELLEWLEGLTGVDGIWVRAGDGMPTRFIQALRAFAWVPTTQGLQRPEDVLVDSQRLRQILGESFPFVQRSAGISPRLSERLGFRTAPSLNAVVDSLLRLKESGEEVQGPARKIYSVLADSSADAIGASRREIEEAFHTNELVFVGDIWRSPRECIWTADPRVFESDFGVLRDEYLDQRDFFLGMLEVPREPCGWDYLKKWQSVCESGAQPQDESVWLIWRGILTSPDCQVLLSTAVAETWLLLPTVQKKLRPPGEVVVADTLAWKVFSEKQGDEFGFAWPGPGLLELPPEPDLPEPQEALMQAFGSLGAARCPGALRVEERRSGKETSLRPSQRVLRPVLVQAVDVYMRAKMERAVDSKALEDLKTMQEIAQPELFATYSLFSSEGDQLAEVTQDVYVLWDREGNKLFLRASSIGSSGDRLALQLDPVVLIELGSALAKGLLPATAVSPAGGGRPVEALRSELVFFIRGNVHMPEATILEELRQDPDMAKLLPKNKLDVEPDWREPLPPLGDSTRGPGHGDDEEQEPDAPTLLSSAPPTPLSNVRRSPLVADPVGPAPGQRQLVDLDDDDGYGGGLGGRRIVDLDDDDGEEHRREVRGGAGRDVVDLDDDDQQYDDRGGHGADEGRLRGGASVGSRTGFDGGRSSDGYQPLSGSSSGVAMPAPRRPGPMREDRIAGDAEWSMRLLVLAQRGASIGNTEARDAIAEVREMLDSGAQEWQYSKPLASIMAKVPTKAWKKRCLPKIYKSLDLSAQKLARASPESRKLVDALLTMAMLPPGLGTTLDNRGLAYYGDALLGAFVAEILYETAPVANTGCLTAWRSHLVRLEACDAYFNDLGIEDCLLTRQDLKGSPGRRKGEESEPVSERTKAEAFEAVLGALVLGMGKPAGRNLLKRCIDGV